MKKTLSLFIFFVGFFAHAQKTPAKATRGVLIYYMHEPFFFSSVDTSLVNISKNVGYKLDKFDFKDVFDSISHKHKVEIYINDKGKLDTLITNVGVLPVVISLKTNQTKLSPEANAFGMSYRGTPLLFKYTIRFDFEIVSMKPLLESDLKLFKDYINKL